MLFLLLAVALTGQALARPRFARYLTPELHIRGGRDVSHPGKYPWQAALRFEGVGPEGWCAGTLVHARYVTTAAHCVQRQLSAIDIGLGYHNLDDRNIGGPRDYTAMSVTDHPNYNPDGSLGFPYNIAMVQLTQAADISSVYIGTIRMAPADSGGDEPDYTGAACIITGWGVTDSGTTASVLQEAEADVLTQDQCRNGVPGRLGGWGIRIQRHHVCMGDLRNTPPEASTCNGDSGGPLQCNVGGSYELVGTTSWGRTGCDPNWPTVYVRISTVRTWIDSVIN